MKILLAALWLSLYLSIVNVLDERTYRRPVAVVYRLLSPVRYMRRKPLKRHFVNPVLKNQS